MKCSFIALRPHCQVVTVRLHHFLCGVSKIFTMCIILLQSEQNFFPHFINQSQSLTRVFYNASQSSTTLTTLSSTLPLLHFLTSVLIPYVRHLQRRWTGLVPAQTTAELHWWPPSTLGTDHLLPPCFCLSTKLSKFLLKNSGNPHSLYQEDHP